MCISVSQWCWIKKFSLSHDKRMKDLNCEIKFTIERPFWLTLFSDIANIWPFWAIRIVRLTLSLFLYTIYREKDLKHFTFDEWLLWRWDDSYPAGKQTRKTTASDRNVTLSPLSSSSSVLSHFDWLDSTEKYKRRIKIALFRLTCQNERKLFFQIIGKDSAHKLTY